MRPHIISVGLTDDPNKRDVLVRCPVCKVTDIVIVPLDGLSVWLDGAHIQNVMPDLTPDNREMLISGTCPKCWKEIFGNEVEGPENP